jgi:hypothetical protein
MDIHKPKAAHNWREFLTEIGTIVCGILIALTLEEGLRILRDRETADQALQSVRGELSQNLSFMNGRLATLPCVERRLEEIGALLEASGEGPLKRPPNWVGQPPIWFLTDQRWQAATASGRTSLLPPSEQGDIAGLYSYMNRFNEGERDEQAAWSQLRGLETWTGALGPVGRVHFLEALQQARYETWHTRITIGSARLKAKELGIADAAPKAMMGRFSIPHAVCLPIDTPRAKALEILTKDGSPPWGQPK